MNSIFLAPTTFAQFSKIPLKLFEREKYKITPNLVGRKLLPNEILKYVSNVTGIIAGTELYTKEILDELPNLKVISRLGVGMDNIDMGAVHANGIKVFKTKTTPAPAVAELTLGLMLDVARKISAQNQSLKSGTWKKEMGKLLHAKTLGIIGLGTIGKTLVKLVSGFNFKLLVYDLYHDKTFGEENNITYCDLDTLLKESDIISIHLNLSDQTKNMMNMQRLRMMKPDSILINTSRGEIIDEDALYSILKDKKILGAGLDVFNEEPYSGLLAEIDNVVLTPHIGAYAKEIRIEMEMEAVENLIKGLDNG
jgi:D-3-phosphoglycerate dehydrogenase